MLYCVYVCMCVGIDCNVYTRKWIGNAVQKFSSFSVRSRDKIARVCGARRAPPPGPELASVFSLPKVDKSMIQLPSLLLVVGAVSLPLKCAYFL